MKIRLLEIARQELDDAVAYYNADVAGLGGAFLLEVLAGDFRMLWSTSTTRKASS